MQGRLGNAFLISSIFLNGFSVLVLEILGTRLLSPYYGSTIFVWSAVISVTLGALAAGYWIGGRLGDRSKHPGGLFFFLLLAGGVGVCATPAASRTLMRFLDIFGYQWAPLVGAFVLFFIPLLLLAAATTVAVAAWGRNGELSVSTTGSVFGLSTAGSIVGALASGFLLVPNVSIDIALIAVGGALALCGGIGWYWMRREAAGSVPLLLCFVMVVAFGVVAQPEEAETVFRRHGYYGEVRVVELPGFGRCLAFDRILQGCRDPETGDAAFEIYTMLIQPVEDRVGEASPPRVLFLGLGAGIGPELLHRGVEKTVVEIDPLVLEVARTYFGFDVRNETNVVVDDARAFLRKTDMTYDFVIADLYRGASTDPFVWTREMFLSIRDVLADDGMLIINLPATLEEHGPIDDVLATLYSVYPFVRVAAPHPAEFANVVLYASRDARVANYGNPPRDVSGVVLTDLHNNIEHTYAASAIRLLALSKKILADREGSLRVRNR